VEWQSSSTVWQTSGGGECFAEFNLNARGMTDTEMGELLFVVDQDGTVGIYTNNFPGPILRRVRKILKAIAGKLYCRDTSDSSGQVTDQSF
jgi:hypothetical protein